MGEAPPGWSNIFYQKRYSLLAALWFCLVLLLAGCAYIKGLCKINKAVEFADPKLEEAVRAALDKPAGELTVKDLSGLEELYAPGHDISDLGGLEHAANLRHLNLYRNRIDDLTPLRGLEKLDLRYNYLPLSNADTSGILKDIRQSGVDLQVEPTYYD
ncbi:MAG: leucine-rich repeat domain-containing protein [Firmicutes bacterium]|nr:leucine-rich repeat domain-containing protein [Bacillota bacterium]